uniref:CSON007259 protein n=1 Tax=Culicoides sonorensis TaxID=179676 RepID=A0A336N626_CULSO
MRKVFVLLVIFISVQSITAKLGFMDSLNVYERLFDTLATTIPVAPNVPGKDCKLKNELFVFKKDDFTDLPPENKRPIPMYFEDLDREEVCNRMVKTLEQNQKAAFLLNTNLYNRLTNRLGINEDHTFGVRLYECNRRATSNIIAFYGHQGFIKTDWCWSVAGQECSSLGYKDIKSLTCGSLWK